MALSSLATSPADQTAPQGRGPGPIAAPRPQDGGFIKNNDSADDVRVFGPGAP